MNQAYREFEFDLPSALLARLIDVFEELDTAPLTSEGLEGVPNEQGVYQLHHKGALVYIGKTDAEAGLHKRLQRHARKIMFRKNLSPEEVSYKAVRIFVFTAIDLETQLIKHYGKKGGVAWNKSGFGANDPGRKRDHTKIKNTNFDARFPIDLDRPVEVDFTKFKTVATALAPLKSALAYLLRFEGKSKTKPHPDLVNTPLELPNGHLTPRTVLERAIEALPSGWQATALPSHILLYKESVDNYPDAEIIGRS